MELSDVEASLPNGFHDMRLAALHLNLCDQIVVLEVDILVGLPDQNVETSDEYRGAVLKFRDAKASAIDPPHPESAYRFPGAASVVVSEGEAGSFPEELLADLPADLRIYTIFVRDWLANIRIAAAGVELTWKKDDRTSGHVRG